MERRNAILFRDNYAHSGRIPRPTSHMLLTVEIKGDEGDGMGEHAITCTKGTQVINQINFAYAILAGAIGLVLAFYAAIGEMFLRPCRV